MIRRFLKSQPGIAVAPILMAIALLAVVVAAFSRGADMLGGAAINQDRIVYDLQGQIDMIRSKIEECVMLTRGKNIISGYHPTTGEPISYYDDIEYPVANTDTLVSALECPRDPAGRRSLWQGARPSNLPPVPKGFEPWMFRNRGDPERVLPGGICIKIRPLAANASKDTYRDAIRKALRRYSADEITYNPGDANQQIIIWIRRPATGTAC